MSRNSRDPDRPTDKAGDRRSDLASAVPWILGTNVILGVLCLCASIVWLIILSGDGAGGGSVGLGPDSEAIAAQVRARLDVHKEELIDEAASLAAETVPPVTEAFYQQIREDMPVYLKVVKQQSAKLGDDLLHAAKLEVREQYEDFLSQQRAVLAEEFPEHATEEDLQRLEKRFVNAFESMAERYYLIRLEEQGRRMAELWEKVEPLPDPPSNSELVQQLGDYAADWTVLAVTDRVQEGAMGLRGNSDDESDSDNKGDNNE